MTGAFSGRVSGEEGRVQRSIAGEALLRLPVRVHDIQLGWPVDLAVDLDARRALGLEVRCGDGKLRFLPFPALRLGAAGVTAPSALTLLDEQDASFYRTRARSLRALRGSIVKRAGHTLGALVDVVVDADGVVAELVVSASGGTEPIPFADELEISVRKRTAA